MGTKLIYESCLRENTKQLKLYTQLLAELKGNFYNTSHYKTILNCTEAKVSLLCKERLQLNVGLSNPIETTKLWEDFRNHMIKTITSEDYELILGGANG